jgi:hypothetical protein
VAHVNVASLVFSNFFVVVLKVKPGGGVGRVLVKPDLVQ